MKVNGESQSGGDDSSIIAELFRLIQQRHKVRKDRRSDCSVFFVNCDKAAEAQLLLNSKGSKRLLEPILDIGTVPFGERQLDSILKDKNIVAVRVSL
jgi:hypothetical protein